jgi:membrane fusion protein (multidrug efflux system)
MQVWDTGEHRVDDEIPRKSLRPFVILAAVLLVVGGAFGLYGWHNSFFATTDDAEIDGNLYAIAAQIGGRVTLVAVGDNQHVTTGQLLVQLDDRDQQVALLKAEAGMAQAQADLAQDQAQEAEAAANVTQAQDDYSRFISINPRATTAQQVDAATDAVVTAKARLAAAQALVQRGEANLAAAGAALADAKLQLSYTQILAPANGHVSMKSVQPGNVVAAGTPMMSLVSDEVWVTANYKETQLSGIRIGSEATVSVDAVPGVTFKAKVDSIQYGTGAVFSMLPAQNATGNYIKVIQRVPVKLVFTDDRVKQYLLAPGMSVEPSIRVSP